MKHTDFKAWLILWTWFGDEGVREGAQRSHLGLALVGLVVLCQVGHWVCPPSSSQRVREVVTQASLPGFGLELF